MKLYSYYFYIVKVIFDLMHNLSFLTLHSSCTLHVSYAITVCLKYIHRSFFHECLLEANSHISFLLVWKCLNFTLIPEKCFFLGIFFQQIDRLLASGFQCFCWEVISHFKAFSFEYNHLSLPLWKILYLILVLWSFIMRCLVVDFIFRRFVGHLESILVCDWLPPIQLLVGLPPYILTPFTRVGFYSQQKNMAEVMLGHFWDRLLAPLCTLLMLFPVIFSGEDPCGEELKTPADSYATSDLGRRVSKRPPAQLNSHWVPISCERKLKAA